MNTKNILLLTKRLFQLFDTIIGILLTILLHSITLLLNGKINRLEKSKPCSKSFYYKTTGKHAYGPTIFWPVRDISALPHVLGQRTEKDPNPLLENSKRNSPALEA